MSGRITTRSMQESTLASLQANLSAMTNLQQQLSTGSRINKPSDDPAGTVTALQLQQELRNKDQYSRNITDGQSWLGTVDTALQTSVSQMNRAYDLAVQASSAASTGTTPKAAIATELEGIKKTLLSLANTQYAGRNVFAGTSGATDAVTAAADPNGVDPVTGETTTTYSYTWADTGSGTVDRRIGASSSVRVDSDGTAVFGADDPNTGTASLFTTLDKMISAVKASNSSDPTVAAAASTALGEAMSALQSHTTTVSTELSSVGAREKQLDGAASSITDDTINLQTSLSSVKDADMASTYVSLQMQQTAYQAALAATSKVLQPSLMDFLK
jgi:flagellar hook-associated protein 3 FlgL